MRSSLFILAAACLAIAESGQSMAAEELPAIQRNVTVHTLANGWTFVIYERPGAPVFSFATNVHVGSAQEVPGITGIAHMFEHMAFKGTPRIGTSDYPAEKAALEKVDATWAAYDAERRRPAASAERVKELEKAFKQAQEEADRFIVKNEFGDLVDRAGGVALNASTSADNTDYFYSLPSNKVELWAYLESERFLDPVFREFYKERDVVKEERRMRTESTPFGRLLEQFLAAAYVAHPYGQPTVGHMSDLDSFSREDAEEFYETYYVPSNMVTAVVGDVKAAEIIPIIEKYFGRVPKGDPPPPVRTVEPPQKSERIVRLIDPSQPIYAEGYHKGAATDPDEPVFEAISDVLSNGRTSRFYRTLVRDKQIAVTAQSLTGFPGARYPGLFILFAVPSRGHSNEEVRDALRAELTRLATEDVSDEELAMVKTRAKASLLRGLDSNIGLASQLSEYQMRRGDWTELFHSVEKIEKVTKADIRRVSAATFVETNRTVGMIETALTDAAPAGPASKKEGGR